MEHIEKTVFISYRRTNFPWALNVYQDLTHHGFDVFIDYQGIGSGAFESVILGNITARAHFLILLTPSALERCGEPGDLLRREIETAMETRRNVIPLMLEGFSFGTPAIATQLTGSLAPLKDYNGLSMPAEYFLAAMDKLRGQFLNIPLTAVIHPASASAKQAASQQKAAANAAPAVQEEELTAQQYFERALAATEPDERLRFYNEAIRLKPDFAAALNNRGVARRDKGDLDGAIADSNEAIQLKSDYAEAFNNRGVARMDNGDMEGAIADYIEAIRLKPDYASAFYNRGIARGIARDDRGDLEGAIADYDKAIQLKPDYTDAFYNRGIARKKRGDLNDAIADYNEAIRLKPDHANAFYNRAEVFQKQDQFAAAIADFLQYLKLGGGDRDGDTAEVEQRIADLKKKL